MITQLFLMLAVSVGQADTPPKAALEEEPPPEKLAEPTPPPTSAAPDRWLLMRSLQGTWPGWLLDSNRLQVSGWTQMSYTASTAQVSNLPMGMNYLPNQFAMEQNWLRFERSIVTTGTTPSYGFRTDWILPGTDGRFTLPRGLWNGQLTANNGQPNMYVVDPVQFYAQAFIPTIGRGLDIKFGRMYCQFGAEVTDAVSNALASHSYAYFYNPFTHTGVMGTLQLTPDWSVQLGAVLGPDVFIDPAASPYGMFSVKWAPPGGRNSVLVSGLIGSGRYNVEESFNNPNVVDLVYTHTFNSRLSYTLDAIGGWQTNVPGIGTATWFAAVNYLTYVVTPRLSATTRTELFDDVQGNRTGFAGLYTAATTGLNFKLRKGIIFRPEIRYDYNLNATPFEGRHDLFTATADVILRW